MVRDKHIKCRVEETLQKEASKLFKGSMSDGFRKYIQDNVRMNSEGQKFTHTCHHCKNEFKDKELDVVIWTTGEIKTDDWDALFIFCKRCQKKFESISFPLEEKEYEASPEKFLLAGAWQSYKKDEAIYKLTHFAETIVALARNYPKQYKLLPGVLYMPQQTKEDLTADMKKAIELDQDHGFI